MTVTQAPGAAWAFAWWFALGLSMLPPAALAQQRAAETALIPFDIAAQPLDAALAAYTQATGMAVLVTSRAPAGAVTRYAGVLQNTVTRALCQWTGAQFGRYRASLQLWIGRNGVVRQARVLAGTGDARRDEALAGVLAGLIMDTPPPADLPQPVTIVLAPRPDPRADCRLAGAAG